MCAYGEYMNCACLISKGYGSDFMYFVVFQIKCTGPILFVNFVGLFYQRAVVCVFLSACFKAAPRWSA